MSKNTFLSVILFLSVFVASAQLDKALHQLLANNHKAALELSKDQSPKSIEDLIMLEIIKSENGLFNESSSFSDQLTDFDHYEPYLFGLWNAPFIFNDYRKNGLDKNARENLDYFTAREIKSPIIRNAIYYLKAIESRDVGDWEGYRKYNNKINAIRQWQYCGPFENLNGSGIDRDYPPERVADTFTDFDTEGHGIVRWYTPLYSDVEAYQYFVNQLEYGTGVNYAQTFITSPMERSIILQIGYGGAIKVFLNDIEIAAKSQEAVTEMGALNIEVKLNKGVNRLLIKSASKSKTPYFIVSPIDTEGKALENLSVSLKPEAYQKPDETAPHSEILKHVLIDYLATKSEQDGTLTSRFVNDYVLIAAYLRNSDYKSARPVLDKWLAKYPKSSTLASILNTIYVQEGRAELSNEVQKNMRKEDPDYFGSVLNEISEVDKLFKKDRVAFEKTLMRIKTVTDLPVMKTFADLLESLRDNNISTLRMNLDTLMENEGAFPNLKNIFVELYDNVLHDEEKTIHELEKLLGKNSNYAVFTSLANHYYKTNQKQKADSLFAITINDMGGDNNFIMDYVNLLQMQEKYAESLDIIQVGLKNYPFSALLYSAMGDAELQLGHKKEAVQAYQKALSHNSLNTDLRNKIYDLKNIVNPLDALRTPDHYGYIAKNRGKIKQNNYGINILLEESDILVYSEGGGKYVTTMIYEVTSQDGVEDLKEYKLNLGGSYTILKSETVKPDGSIVPAERSGSNFVFNKLEVGDVILIDYEAAFSSSGRFYKDFISDRSFDYHHPTLKSNYKLLVPKGYTVHYKVSNGELDFKKTEEKNFTLYQWSGQNIKGLPAFEKFSPALDDMARTLHISSIKSWDDIADWYADLVRNQMEYDGEVQRTFDTIFPEGVKSLSQMQIAEKIYDYMTGELSYSYVNFKQSGYVPQKPGKTLTSKLGDCKDFSTLFVCLARKAGLEAHLVLTLTADHGKEGLVLPCTDFNHCLASVDIDGQQHYIELTDKFLPFCSLPISDQGAIVLDVPIDDASAITSELHYLKSTNRIKGGFYGRSVVNINDTGNIIQLHAEYKGHVASYGRSLFANPNPEKVKKDFNDGIRSFSGLDLNVLEVGRAETKQRDAAIALDAKIAWNEKGQKIGALNTIKIPFISIPYNRDIVALKERKLPIDYRQYEIYDRYDEEYILKLEKGKQFVEMPKNVDLSYQGHSYRMDYKLIDPGTLKVRLLAQPDLKRIKPEEYPAFKAYVDKVIETRETLIGYK